MNTVRYNSFGREIRDRLGVGGRLILGLCGDMCMQYSVYAVLSECSTSCIQYSVNAVLRVCSTQCMQYSVYAVLSVTHDHGMERRRGMT